MDSLQQALHQSVFLSALSAHPSRDLPLCWEQHCKLLPGVAGVQASGVAHWTVEEVRHVACVCDAVKGHYNAVLLYWLLV